MGCPQATESEQFRGRGSIGPLHHTTGNLSEGGDKDRADALCLAGPVLPFVHAWVLPGTTVNPETEKRPMLQPSPTLPHSLHPDAAPVAQTPIRRLSYLASMAFAPLPESDFSPLT